MKFLELIFGTSVYIPFSFIIKLFLIIKGFKVDVMIVEAMKTMNHVPSPKDGVVKSVNVEDGQPVEYGQTLVVID